MSADRLREPECQPLAGMVGLGDLVVPRLGATPLGDPGSRLPARTSFAVYAPFARVVECEILPGEAGPARRERLEPVRNGYHEGVLSGVGPGDRYRYRLDGGPGYPDPFSRSQPDGVHGPSEIVGPPSGPRSPFRSPPRSQWVIYELHVGTFSAEGTLDAAIAQLSRLAELGVTAVEPLPLGEFAGSRGWGYDCVFPASVHHSYGGPAALQRFVEACHDHGLAVVLDLIFNHLGPEGNVLAHFGPYFTDRYRTPWGDAPNFDGECADEVRRYFIEVALSFVDQFAVDGLRLDAIHAIADPTATPFVAELTDAVRRAGEELGRSCQVIAESADNNPAVVRQRHRGGLGFDAQWNDDFHHAVHVALTGERQGYYADYRGLDDLALVLERGWLFEGRYSSYRGRRHGAPANEVEPDQLVACSQNHDQVGNRPDGERLAQLVGFERLRLAAVVLLCTAQVPMLFMGEEYGETAPFPFFADHSSAALRASVTAGRRAELEASFGRPGFDPYAQRTFERAKIDPARATSGKGAALTALYRRCIELRRTLICEMTPGAQVRAAAVGEVLEYDVMSVYALRCNFSASPVTVDAPRISIPSGDPVLELVLDGADERFGGGRDLAPARLDVGETVELGPFGFCCYRSMARSWR